MTPRTMLEEAWAALGADASRTGDLIIDTAGAPLAGPVAVGELAVATAGTALLAAADLAEVRGVARPAAALEAAHVAVAFASERYTRLDGASPGAAFDPLSTFLPTRDGWIRLHGNYPHHRAAIMRALGHPRDGAAGVPAAVAERDGEDLEKAIVAAGGAAAAVRDRDTWRSSAGGAALAGTDLLDFDHGVARSVPGLAPLPGGAGGAGGAGATLPMAGLKVLDLTRVISGPVGTRVLSALGAQVLRVDAPLMAELPLLWLDTGAGKRSVHLQLRNRPDRERLHRLLDDTDVLVTGYRPTALDPFGLSRDVLEEKHPHLCTVSLSAWGEHGGWCARRGFDSLVQSATGIALEVSPDGGATPGVLSVQALDHGTGYLAAAAAMRALTLREQDGRASHARLALARTAAWLLDRIAGGPAAGPGAPAAPDPTPYLDTLRSELGTVTVARPPGTLDGVPLGWATGPPAPGADAPYWR